MNNKIVANTKDILPIMELFKKIFGQGQLTLDEFLELHKHEFNKLVFIGNGISNEVININLKVE